MAKTVLEVMKPGALYRTHDIIRLTERPAPVAMQRLSNLAKQGRIVPELRSTRSGTLTLWKRAEA